MLMSGHPMARPFIAALSFVLLSGIALVAAAETPKVEAGLVKFGDGIFGYYPSQVSEQELLDHYAERSALTDLPQAKRIEYRRTYLDLVLSFDADRARRHMPVHYPVIPNETPEYLALSKNWEWVTDLPARRKAERPVHTSKDDRPHSALGVSRYVLSPGAVLRQQVYIDPGDPAEEISVAFTVPVFRYAGYTNRLCRARWGGKPIPVRTDNTPYDFYAGPLPETGKWVTFEVPAIDIGLGGMRPIFSSIEFRSAGGKALWGATVFRRAELELFPTEPLGVFRRQEDVELQVRVNNPLRTARWYSLKCDFHGLDGNCLQSEEHRIEARPGRTAVVPLKLLPQARRKSSGRRPMVRRIVRLPSYFVARATLARRDALATASTSFGLIAPRSPSRDPDSPFGCMLWDRPASEEGVRLYRDAGIKAISINPGKVKNGEGPLLSLYAAEEIYVHSRIWDLAFVSAKEARAYQGKQNPLVPKLTNRIRSLGPMGGHFVSNFWEVDLRNLPETYGLNAKYFRDAVKQANPQAVVGTGGLAGANMAYVDVMMGNGGAGHLDFVTCMGYLTPGPPERSGLFEELAAMRELFKRHNSPETRLWLSEWSYFDHLNIERPELSAQWLNSGVSRDLISTYVIREAVLALASGVSKVFPNAPFQPSRRPLSQTYGHTMTGCSSHRHDRTPLPMYFAWANLTRQLEGKEYGGRIDCGPGVYCFRFDAVHDARQTRRPDPSLIVLWSGYGVKPVGLRTERRRVTVHDFVGNRRALSPLDGVVSLTATPRPQYLLLGGRGVPDSVKSVAPLIQAEPPEHEVVYGEQQEIDLGFRVDNPGEKSLNAKLRFRGPNWCVSQTDAIRLRLGPKESCVERLRVRIPADNGDRVHYEFAGVVNRAEHILAAVLEAQGEEGLAQAVLRVREPLRVRLRPFLERRDDRERPKLVVQILNRSSSARKGTVELRTKARIEMSPRSREFAVEPRWEVSLTFEVRGGPIPADKETGAGKAASPGRVRISDYDKKKGGYYYSFGIGEGYVIEAVLKCEDGYENRQSRGFSFLPCVKAAGPPKIDGKEDDWEDAVWLKIDPGGRINALPFFANVHSHNKENVGMYFKGPSDLSVRWAAKWDESCLYLFFRVMDDNFHQPYTGNMLWNGDSVRLAIDPRPELTDAGIQPEPRDPASFQMLDIGLTTGGPQVYRRYHACGQTPGAVRAAKVSISRRADGLSYELAIPWDELDFRDPRAGGWLQMSIAFDDSDGHGRKTWINWFGGLGGIAREPRLMGDLNLVE